MTVARVRKLLSANKAIAAGLTTFVGALGAATVSWVESGQFNVAETRVAAGGLLLALLTAGVTYMTSAGDAEVELPSTPRADKLY